jgi:hypothetical protein
MLLGNRCRCASRNFDWVANVFYPVDYQESSMSPRMIRWLTLAALLVPALLLLTPVQAQPGRAGGLGGNRPGGIPGSMGGAPGGMAGQPGGIAGGGIAGGGIAGGGIGQGGLQDEWVCSRCGAVIGHGGMKPAWARCPTCGAQFTDGPGGMDADPPTSGPAAAPSGSQPKPTSANSGASGSSRTVLIAVGIGVGVLVLFGAVGVIVYLSVSRNIKRGGSRRRKRVDLD